MEVEDYSTLSDSSIYHMASGGNAQAKAELARREAKARVLPGTAARVAAKRGRA